MTDEYDSNCPLCRAEHLTPWIWEDEVCWICYCATHTETPMIVLKRHSAEPTPEEMEHIKAVKNKLFPELRFRGHMQSLPDHWHEHLVP